MSVSRRALLVTAAGAAAVGPVTEASAAPAAAGRAPASAAGQVGTGATLRTLSEAAEYAVAKVRAVAPRVTGFPVGTKFEKWTYSRGGDWVGGFWPGTLWMAYLYSGDDTFRARAVESARNLAPARPTRPPTTSVSCSTPPGSPPGA